MLSVKDRPVLERACLKFVIFFSKRIKENQKASETKEMEICSSTENTQ